MTYRVFGGLLVALLAGCTTTRPVGQDFIIANRPAEVWVTRADGSVIHVLRPKIVGDTLLGFVNDTLRRIGIMRGTTVLPVSKPAHTDARPTRR